MPEANARLRAVTDFVEKDPWPKLTRYRGLIAIGALPAALLLWWIAPHSIEPMALLPEHSIRAHGAIPPERLAELLNAAKARWG